MGIVLANTYCNSTSSVLHSDQHTLSSFVPVEPNTRYDDAWIRFKVLFSPILRIYRLIIDIFSDAIRITFVHTTYFEDSVSASCCNQSKHIVITLNPYWHVQYGIANATESFVPTLCIDLESRVRHCFFNMTSFWGSILLEHGIVPCLVHVRHVLRSALSEVWPLETCGQNHYWKTMQHRVIKHRSKPVLLFRRPQIL